jgi:hypothetical protein
MSNSLDVGDMSFHVVALLVLILVKSGLKIVEVVWGLLEMLSR